MLGILGIKLFAVSLALTVFALKWAYDLCELGDTMMQNIAISLSSESVELKNVIILKFDFKFFCLCHSGWIKTSFEVYRIQGCVATF